MPKYLIKRNVPGAADLGPAELQAISQKSNAVLDDLTSQGETVQWLQSYVTDDALHCVYYASGPEVIREHARCGGFPCDEIMQIGTMIDPSTAEVAS